MKCSVCCDAGVSNAFTKGSGNMRVSNIEHHMELDEHKTSVRTQTARKEVLLRATQLWLDAPISLSTMLTKLNAFFPAQAEEKMEKIQQELFRDDDLRMRNHFTNVYTVALGGVAHTL
jgi:hypothetical protein